MYNRQTLMVGDDAKLVFFLRRQELYSVTIFSRKERRELMALSILESPILLAGGQEIR